MSRAVARRPVRVGIGVLDTGVDETHPSLRGRVTRFLWVDPEGRADPERPAFDGDGHGTHLAARICGRAVGEQPGGVAPRGRLYCAAVMEGGLVPVRLMVGLEWLCRQPIRVALLPFGIPGKTRLLEGLVRRLRRRGVLVVAAVGNGGSSRFDTPGCYPEVLSVGACDRGGNPAGFSGSYFEEHGDRCLKPDLLAPGVEISSACAGGGWSLGSGTSIASAQVAGAAAQLFSLVPEASDREVEAALLRSARPVHPSHRHRCGHGVLNLEAAKQLLRGSRPLRRPSRPASCWLGEPKCDPQLQRRMQLRTSRQPLPVIALPCPEGPKGPAFVALVTQLAEASRRRCAPRVLPGAHGVFLLAHAALLRRLLREPRVGYVHCAEPDIAGWSPWR